MSGESERQNGRNTNVYIANAKSDGDENDLALKERRYDI